MKCLAAHTWLKWRSVVRQLIGETSARACEDLGFSAVFFPDKPGIPGWAASVRDAVASLGAE